MNMKYFDPVCDSGGVGRNRITEYISPEYSRPFRLVTRLWRWATTN
ncbi:MAG: hypothetical protein HS126_00015 [Anaerolineales bacterium]|nr:hypothetical protein [Anaerolineales bacterium]